MDSRSFQLAKRSAKKPKGESRTFFEYIESGNVDALNRQFANKKALINEVHLLPITDNTSQTRILSPIRPLHFAIRNSQWKVVEFLLEKDADPNGESFLAANMITGFHYFISWLANFWLNKQSIMPTDLLNKLLNLFLDKGADFSALHSDVDVISALTLGATFIQLDFFKKLIAKMGRENFQASLENPRYALSSTGTRVLNTPPLHILCSLPVPMHLELFLRNGADPLQEANGFTPLGVCMEQLRVTQELAALPLTSKMQEEIKLKSNSLEMMFDILIRHLADRAKSPNALKGTTYLHEAAARNMCVAAAKLITLGLDINAFSIEGKTPLFLAANNGRIEMVRLLAETPGCNLMLGLKLPEEETTSLKDTMQSMQAEKKERKGNKSFLFSNAIPITPLFVAFLRGHEQIVRYLLEKSPVEVRNNLIEAIRVALPQLDEQQREFLAKFPEIQSAASSQTFQLVTHSDGIELILESGNEEFAISQWKTLKQEQIELPRLLSKAIYLGAEKFIRFLCTDYADDIEKLIKADTQLNYLAGAIFHLLSPETLDLLLDRGSLPFDSKFGFSAIHLAIERNHMPALSHIVKRFPASVDTFLHGETPMLTAISLHCDEAATMLLTNRVNPLVSHEHKNKNSLLLFIKHNRQPLLQLVLEQFPHLDLNPSNPQNVGMPYLTEAYQNSNSDLFIILFEHGARDTNFLRSSQTLKWLKNLNRAEIVEWAEKVIEEKKTTVSASPSLHPAFEYTEPTPTLSGKQPYRDAWKAQKSDSTDDKSTAQATSLVFDNKLSLFKSESETFTWFNALSSEHSSVTKMGGGTNLFLYLDQERLISQELSLEVIQAACLSPKLNGNSIKTLQFKHIQCSISLNGNIQPSHLMAEIRFFTNPALKEKRIFLWPVIDQTKRATLLIGFDLSNALHEHKDIKALMQSFKIPKTIELTSLKLEAREENGYDSGPG